MAGDYDPVKTLREEVDRFKATNTFTPMFVTGFYIQAGCVLNRLEETERELEAANSRIHQLEVSGNRLSNSEMKLLLEVERVKRERDAFASLLCDLYTDGQLYDATPAQRDRFHELTKGNFE